MDICKELGVIDKIKPLRDEVKAYFNNTHFIDKLFDHFFPPPPPSYRPAPICYVHSQPFSQPSIPSTTLVASPPKEAKKDDQGDQDDLSKHTDTPLESDENSCKICMENKQKVLLSPCNHISTCISCSKQITSCPMCRVQIQKKIVVFFS